MSAVKKGREDVLLRTEVEIRNFRTKIFLFKSRPLRVFCRMRTQNVTHSKKSLKQMIKKNLNRLNRHIKIQIQSATTDK